MRKLLFFTISLLFAASAAQAGLSVVDVIATHYIKPNVVYSRADGMDLKLDIYAPRANLYPKPSSSSGPRKAVPTLVYFHGGGWMGGSKDSASIRLMPYLQKGWAAVAVQYRLGGEALAPAAIEDTRCATWWVKRNAEKYGFDPDRIVLSGSSAGGHISLITGMLTTNAGLDGRCPGLREKPLGAAELPELKVAAIVNWFGITDVNDLISGANMKTYAVMWMGSLKNRDSIAKQVSPLSYIHKNLPPILTLHGDKDEVVPYSHAVRLHKKLDKNGTPNQLHTVKGAGHGGFSVAETRTAFSVIDSFLAKYVGE
jgi:acetyl esterase/lipase